MNIALAILLITQFSFSRLIIDHLPGSIHSQLSDIYSNEYYEFHYSKNWKQLPIDSMNYSINQRLNLLKSYGIVIEKTSIFQNMITFYDTALNINSATINIIHIPGPATRITNFIKNNISKGVTGRMISLGLQYSDYSCEIKDIGNNRIISIQYNIIDPIEDVQNHLWQTYFIKNRIIVVISFNTPTYKFSSYYPLYREMIKSFRIKKRK